MKVTSPFLFRSANSSSNRSPAKTFGAARAEKIEQRLQHARQERVKLTKAQYASPEPLNKVYEQKRDRLSAKINRLENDK